MNNFYLIRHGDKLTFSGDPGISDLGVKQAQLTGKYFIAKGIFQIISSPQKRALETAKNIAEHLGLDIKIDNRLRERMNWGDKKGQSFEEFKKSWDKTTKERNFKPEFGDSSIETGNRLKQVIDELDNKYQNQNFIISTHGGTIADFLRNIFLDTYLKSLKPGFPKTDIQECSITHIIKDKDYILKEFDSTAHLNN